MTKNDELDQQFKHLEKEQCKTKESTRKKIRKIKAEINEVENRKTVTLINISKSCWFFSWKN